MKRRDPKNLIGYVIDKKYEIVFHEADGGSASVYLAKDLVMGQTWAVKCVFSTEDTTEYERLKNEVDIYIKIRYPDIPQIVHYLDKDDYFFEVIQFINGVSLFSKLEREGPQSEKDVVEWGIIITKTIQYLHNTDENKKDSIIYRDLAPKNIILENNRPKLIDFGIAKIYEPGVKDTGLPYGTIGFAAPEQYQKGSRMTDFRTDIYGIGATLFNLLTRKTIQKDPIKNNLKNYNQNLTDGINYIILKCTQVDPEKRYQTTEALLRDLERIETLNDNFRKSEKKKLFKFSGLIVAAALSAIFAFVGYNNLLKTMNSDYQNHFNAAQRYEQQGNLELAQDEYMFSIYSAPAQVDAYIKLFNCLLPDLNESNYVEKTQEALDILRTNYDLKTLKDAPEFLLKVAKEALSVGGTSTVNTKYANELLNVVKKSKEYKKGTINNLEVDSLSMIAENGNTYNPDTNKLKNALTNLDKATDESKDLTESQKLSNYYMILLIYNTYPDVLGNKENFEDISQKAKEIIKVNISKTDFEFNKITPMYQMIAGKYYDLALSENNEEKKNQYLIKAEEWYDDLSKYNATIDKDSLLKKGNLYKDLQNYSNAKTTYNEVLKLEPNNIEAYIALTQASIDEQIKNGTRDFGEATAYYTKLQELKVQNGKDLTSQVHKMLESLGVQMESAGISQ